MKLRLPSTHSALTGTSTPGFAPRASDQRSASAPNCSIQSSGSTTLPADLLILRPRASRISPVMDTVRKGTSSCTYVQNIIIRATQKKMMS